MLSNCPVTLEELKKHLHILSDDFDSNLSVDLLSAAQAAESYIGRAIARSVVNVSAPFSKTFTIPDFATLQNVTVDGNAVEFSQVNNIINLLVDDGKIVRYEIVSGYTQEDCPMDIKMAILLIASRYFSNPVDSVEQLPKASTALLKPYKNYMI